MLDLVQLSVIKIRCKGDVQVSGISTFNDTTHLAAILQNKFKVMEYLLTQLEELLPLM